MLNSILLATDSYKASHAYQYPPGTEYVYSYIESRGGTYDRTVFFGLQMWLKEYLSRPITRADIDEAAEFWAAHGEPFYQEGWEYILEQHQGRLPVEIRAVPEGTIVPVRNVLVTVVNTDPRCWWLTSFLETALLRAVWYPTTVATNSWQCKQIIRRALVRSSDDLDQIAFKLHDFGARGASSQETAALGGAAHLVNFRGSDTVEGVLAARRYYGEPMAGFSIPAAEHSTMTAWGRDREADAYRNMLRVFAKPGAVVAVVSDSYDIMDAVNNIWGGVLRDEVMASGATVVVRPDSGDPLTVPVQVVRALGERFGYTVNSKGYRVLPSCIRVIQGDGITPRTLPVILDNLLAEGYAADNIAFGMGGGLLQQVNRDSQKFAMKASAAYIGGQWVDVYKDPVTDSGKRSKRGRLVLHREGGRWETVPAGSGFDWANALTVVWRDGELTKDWKFSEIRARADQPPLD